MPKLEMIPVGVNGNTIDQNQFGYALKVGHGFTPDGVNEIQFRCRMNSKKICVVPLTLGPNVEDDGNKVRRWHWDGNMQSPTVTPSIGCDARCGWHGHMTSGEIAP